MPIDTPLINAPSFVIQRRIACPLSAVHAGLADRTPLTTPELLRLGTDGYADIAEPFRPMAPLSGRQPLPSWCAPASLLTPRGRVVATVDIEVSMWSHGTTELQLRPVARHPERWSSRRIRRYFALAHVTADETARLLAWRARATRELIELSAARTDAEPVGSRR
jgi:hypothetical protein